MEKRMRTLRHRYGISMGELAAQTGISQQRLSEIELEEGPPTPYREKLVARGFQEVVQERQNRLTELRQELSEWEGQLLSWEKER